VLSSLFFACEANIEAQLYRIEDISKRSYIDTTSGRLTVGFHGQTARFPEMGTAFPGDGKDKCTPDREWERLCGIHELHK